MALDQLGTMFDVDDAKLTLKAPIWHQVLGDLAPEMVGLAVERFFRDPKKCGFFPQPGELRGYIADELADEQRREAVEWNRQTREDAQRFREELAARNRPLALPAPVLTPEEQAAADAKHEAAMADLRQGLAAATAGFAAGKDVWCHPSDLDEERPRRRGLPDISASLADFRARRGPDDSLTREWLKKMEETAE